MRNDIVGIVVCAINSGLAEHYSRYAADREQEQESECPQHGRFELNRTSPHGSNPGKYLDACRHGDDHRGEHEVGLLGDAHADGVHVVGPDNEAERADAHHRVDHRQVAEYRLLGERGDHVGNNSETGNNDDVDFRMAEEPEQVLIKNWVSASGWIEKGRAEIPVRQQHRDRPGKHWKRQENQPSRDEDRPSEQGHFVKRHARRAHVEERRNHIDCAKDRRGAGYVYGEDGQIHGEACFAGRQRSVQHPADA